MLPFLDDSVAVASASEAAGASAVLWRDVVVVHDDDDDDDVNGALCRSVVVVVEDVKNASEGLTNKARQAATATGENFILCM